MAWRTVHSNQGAGLVNALGGWVDATRVIVGVAILAAVGAYLADMDIPTLSHKFKLADGLTAKLWSPASAAAKYRLQKDMAEQMQSGILRWLPSKWIATKTAT